MQIDWQAIGTIIAAVLSGIAGLKGVEHGAAYWRQRRNGASSDGTGPGTFPPGWSDVTGEHRLVLASECQARHKEWTEEQKEALAQLKDDLRKGSDKFATQQEGIAGLEKQVIELRGDIKAGFAQMSTEIRDAVDNELDRHVRTFHRGGSRDTGTYSRPGGGGR